MSSTLHEHAIQNFRENVGSAFKAGTATFPHYTLHGDEHLHELDRLARLLGSHIPKFEQRRDLLDQLRVAICMHDFAMVDIPDKTREEHLRRSMSTTRSFADIVREVHQDEILQSFSQPARVSYLTRVLGCPPPVLDDIFTVAKHHRFHSLTKAPDHLKGLCALMRIVDELDIGPNRAPIATYDALRSRMDCVSKFHWLKHICARAVEDDNTLVVEVRGSIKVFRVFVAIKATERSWRCLQSRVIEKLRQCLLEDGVNQVLRETFQVQFEIAAAPDYLSGSTSFLDPVLKEDLEEIAASTICSVDNGNNPQGKTPPTPPTQTYEPTVITSDTVSVSLQIAKPPLALASHEFRIHAIPVGKIGDFLCRSGRLTLIDNEFIAPKEKYLEGMETTRNRLYVGPADIGKTRAALEWIHRSCAENPNEWLVLRTEYGSIPERIEQIVLDTSLFEGNASQLPRRAILFLDDLPTNLLPISTDSSIDGIRRLFQWFNQVPVFNERRVVGTIRSEDVRKRPDLPKQISQIVGDTAVVTLEPLTATDHKKLWRGMTQGTIVVARNSAPYRYQIDISDAFLAAIAKRGGDPEAIATFIQQAVVAGKQKLDALDARSFDDNAVKIWLTQTWPTIEQAYGVAGKIFFTLARFLEGGLRKEGPFVGALPPHWQFHEVFGPELCREYGQNEINYLDIIHQLGADGYAVGVKDRWIRPRWDFLLQADDLPGVDLHLSNFEWFAAHATKLSKPLRIGLAAHLVAARIHVTTGPVKDAAWEFGGAIATQMLAESQPNSGAQRKLQNEVISRLRKAISYDPLDTEALEMLGAVIGRRADAEQNVTDQMNGVLEAVQLLRQAVTADKANTSAWGNLGIALTKQANLANEKNKTSILEDALVALQRAVELQPNAETWAQVAFCLHLLYSTVEDSELRRSFLQREIAARRKVFELQPKDIKSAVGLSLCLSLEADSEKDKGKRVEIREQALELSRLAVRLDSQNVLGWINLYTRLNQKSREFEKQKIPLELRNELFETAKKAAELNPREPHALVTLALEFSDQSEREDDPKIKLLLKQKALAVHRKAAAIPSGKNTPKRWLAQCLYEIAEIENRPAVRRSHLREAVKLYRSLLKGDTNNTSLLSDIIEVHGKLLEIETPEFHIAQGVEMSGRLIALIPKDPIALGAHAFWYCRSAELPQRASDPKHRLAAIAVCRSAIEIEPKLTTISEMLCSQLAHLYQISNNPELLKEALEIAENLRAKEDNHYALACVFALASQRENALHHLELAFSKAQIKVDQVRKDVDWSNFRKDQAWQQLLAKYDN